MVIMIQRAVNAKIDIVKLEDGWALFADGKCCMCAFPTRDHARTLASAIKRDVLDDDLIALLECAGVLEELKAAA